MKLSRAFIHKNKLASKLNTIRAKISRYNSVVEDTEMPYDLKQLHEDEEKTMDELVRVKTAIHKDSEPVREKIFLMSELKSKTKFLASLSTTKGKVAERYHNGMTQTFIADIDELKQESMVANLEQKIEKLQEELDSFNHNTEVTW